MVSQQGLSLLAPLAANLTCLILAPVGNGDAELLALSSLTALTRLELSFFYGVVTAEGMGALSFLTRLVHLDLEVQNVATSVENWHLEIWQALSSLTAISRLKLQWLTVSDAGVNALARLTALTHLDLGGGHNFTLSDENARALSTLARLTYLDLSGAPLSDEGVRALCNLSALTSLDLTHAVTTLSDETADALASLTGLTYLDLSAAAISDEGVRALCNLSALTSLDLTHAVTTLSDETAGALCTLTSLCKLRLYGVTMSKEAQSLLENSPTDLDMDELAWME